MRESLGRKLVRSQLKCAGYVERKEGIRLTKRADALRVEGRRRRGRPEIEMEGQREERFGRSRREVETEGKGWGEWRRQ